VADAGTIIGPAVFSNECGESNEVTDPCGNRSHPGLIFSEK
jgi:hypothetical protein